MSREELVKVLRENAEWCDGEEWNIPICMGDNQREAADMLENDQRRAEMLIAKLGQMKTQCMTIRNELCMKCGGYHRQHMGACDGCRWKKEV